VFCLKKKKWNRVVALILEDFKFNFRPFHLKIKVSENLVLSQEVRLSA